MNLHRIYKSVAIIQNSLTLLKLQHLIMVILLLLSRPLLAQSGPNRPHAEFEMSLPTPRTDNLLFFLQRNPDANTVIYELNLKKDGSLDKKNPVKGSWIRYNEDGHNKSLTLIEQKFAYGVKCKALKNEVYEIRLMAYKKLPLYLKRSETDQKYRIYIREEGEDMLLKRVFVRVNGGSFWFPKVAYIDLITTNSNSGIELLKRISI